MNQEQEEELRKAAVKIVEHLHEFKPHAILLCGTSSQPAYSLIAEAWRRRFPETPLPSSMPIKVAERKDVKGKKVAFF